MARPRAGIGQTVGAFSKTKPGRGREADRALCDSRSDDRIVERADPDADGGV